MGTPTALEGRSKQPAGRRRRATCLELEKLEDRSLPSGGYLYVPMFDTEEVARYDEGTGS
jgi:hypothetical protein